MNPPIHSQLPSWLAPFCCATPFCALVVFAVGSVFGAIVGTGIVPLFGSLIGAFFGAFAGAFLIDLIRTGDPAQSLQSGIGAFSGSVGGKLIKIFGAVGMLVIIAG